jgi:tetratricopeptide (TPR) repeat protein
LELRRGVFGPDHRKVAQSLTQLAWSLRLQRQFAEAETQARAAVASLRRQSDHGTDLANALRILAHVHKVQLKDLAAAEAEYREALALAEQDAGGKPTALVADIAHDLATLLLIRDHVTEGLALATRSVALHRVVHGDKHPETGHGLRVLGDCHGAMGQWDDAERAFRESLAVFRRAYGRQPHRFAILSLEALLVTLDVQFKDEAADAALRECLAAWQKPDLSFPGAEDVPVQRAFACLDRGDYADAERHFRHALDLHRGSPAGPFDPARVVLQFAIGGTLYDQGRADAARAAFQPLVLPARLAALKADLHPDVQSCLAFTLLVGGEATDRPTALILARRAVEQLKGATTPSRALALWALAMTHIHGGDHDRAIEALREAQALTRPRAQAYTPHGPFQRRQLELWLVRSFLAKGDHAAAEEVWRDGLRMRQADLPSGHPEIAAAQVNLGTFLSDQKRYADAEPLLLAAHEALQAHPQAAASASLKQRLTQARERLVQLYDAWGKPDEAAKWRKELERKDKN